MKVLREVYGVDKTYEKYLDQLEFLFVMKEKSFHDAGYQEVTVQMLQEYLIDSKWKISPKYLHDMANDVLSITHTEIMDYLRLKDVIHAKEESLHAIFSNLI